LTRWTVNVSEETDKALRAYLAQSGGRNEDLSRFIEASDQSRLYDLTTRAIKERNSAFSQDAIADVCEHARRP